ncbi:MAG: type 1 glutamine amidotransferase [bacterium]
MNYNLKLNLNAIDLYPEIMNIYGDRGNILYFRYRASLYGISVDIKPCSIGDKIDINKTDIMFIGGGQDSEQALIYKDFIINKKNMLKDAKDTGKIMLAICGGYQLLLNYYKTLDNKIIEGISIFDGYTAAEPEKPRLTGNIASAFKDTIIVGFENHGGRTYLSESQQNFGKVLFGFGNNGIDKTEGAISNNFYGTYTHGSILPKNFQFCDMLINIAVNNKYKITLDEIITKNNINIDNNFEINARKDIKDLKKIINKTI